MESEIPRRFHFEKSHKVLDQIYGQITKNHRCFSNFHGSGGVKEKSLISTSSQNICCKSWVKKFQDSSSQTKPSTPKTKLSTIVLCNTSGRKATCQAKNHHSNCHHFWLGLVEDTHHAHEVFSVLAPLATTNIMGIEKTCSSLEIRSS